MERALVASEAFGNQHNPEGYSCVTTFASSASSEHRQAWMKATTILMQQIGERCTMDVQGDSVTLTFDSLRPQAYFSVSEERGDINRVADKILTASKHHEQLTSISTEQLDEMRATAQAVRDRQPERERVHEPEPRH